MHLESLRFSGGIICFDSQVDCRKNIETIYGNNRKTWALTALKLRHLEMRISPNDVRERNICQNEGQQANDKKISMNTPIPH